jgi:hypothetical protein
VLPPLTGEAVKVTGEPTQAETLAGVIVTEGVTIGLMLTFTLLLLATVEVAQSSLLVSITDTMSPLLKVEVVNVAVV